jgi:hypothetical protein
MKKGLLLLALSPFLLLFLPAQVIAQGHTHAPHVHGEAALNAAIGDGAIELSLEAPLASLISFEHEPSTPEQTKEFEDMDALLKQADKLIGVPEAFGCKLAQVSVDYEVVSEGAEEGHGHPEPGHDADGDLHEHGEEGHGHGEEAEGHGHDDGAVHRSADIAYVYSCGTVPESGQLDLAPLFKAFPLLSKLRVQTVAPSGQKAQELGPGSAELKW